MSAGRTPRNTVMAGLFVLGSVVLGMFAVIALSNIGDYLTKKADYTVHFSLLDGAEGLDKGAPVKFAGKRVGRVTSVRFEPDTGEPKYVEVKIEIDQKIRLISTIDAQLNKPLLGSGSSINLVPGPVAAPAAPPTWLKNGDAIVGHLGAPGFIAPSDYSRLQSIINNVDAIVTDVKPRIGPIVDQAQTAVTNFRDIAADVKAVTADAREHWPAWRESVGNVLTRIDTESKKFEGLGQEVSDRVKKAGELVDRAKDIVEENRQAIKDTLENVRQITTKANAEGYDKVMALVASATATMQSARSVATQTDELLKEKTPDLKDIILSATIAAQQLKLATTEIRAAPWRLLYQPTKKELENELLYNSVRQYASSVSELRSAAEALKSVTEINAAADKAGPGSAPGRVDQATLDQLTAKLKSAFDQYQQQERSFLDRWVKPDR